MTITIETTQLDPDFNINELTTGTLDGNGVFDVMMTAVKAHLHKEFENNRIRGTDYANAYIQAMNNAMQQASNYALQKAKQALEIQLLEAQLAKLGVDTGLVVKQGALVDAQASHEIAQVAKINHEIEHLFPLQVKLAEHEVRLKDKQVDLAQKDIELKQNQIELGHKELQLKEKQLTIAEKEIGIKEKQLEITEYELTHKLPAEVKNTNAQASLYEQKVITETAQTDPSVNKQGSVIWYNNKVLEQQARTYDNDSKLKVLSVLVDTWKIRYNEDPDNNEVTAINKLTDPTIGQAVDRLLTSTGITQ